MNCSNNRRRLFSLSALIVLMFSAVAALGDDTTSMAGIKAGGKTTADYETMQKQLDKEGYTFTVGPNSATARPLADLCGMKISQATFHQKGDGAVRILSDLPSSWDWREKNGVTPVRDQGFCGSCWAFATVAPLESAIRIKDNVAVNLSEQYLVSCNYDGYGCNGGWWAHDMHLNNGAVTETCYPYTAMDSYCQDNCSHDYRITDWGYVGASNSVPSVAALKSAIYTYGPISVTVAADGYFQAYTGGVFNHHNPGEINHGVVLVGWDDAKGAWILKNSWGTGWGESGYMYIAYGVSSIGYAASYIVYEGDGPEPDSENLALGRPIYASATYSDDYLPEYAVDGDMTSRWAATSTAGEWLYVDLGAVKTVTGMNVQWSLTNFAQDYYLYRWSGDSWDYLGRVNSDGNADQFDFNEPFDARFVLLQCGTPNSGYYVVYEWQVFGR